MQIKISDFKKVVFGKQQKSSGSGGGNAQTVAPDVEIYDPFAEEGKDEEEGQDGDKQAGDGKEKGDEGQQGKEGEGKGEGKEGKEGEEGSEGKEGAGKDGKEGKEGDEKDGKKGKSKGSGGGEKGKVGQSESDMSGLSQEQIQKGAEELLDKLNKANNLPVSPCGSNAKRNDKQKNETPEERDKIEQQAEITRKQIEEIIQKASAEGHKHIFSGAARGTGGKGEYNGPQGDAIPMRMRKPEFLKKIMSFASKEFEKEYYKKGTDWFYTQGYGGNILFKGKPKIAVPQKFIYIMVDVSGSMFGNFDGTGKSLLEYLLGYLPVIAEDFKGQVWWISDGLIEFKDGSPGITLLSDYKNMSVEKQSAYFRKIKDARGSGGGTTFAVELQAVQDLREGKINRVVKDALKGTWLKMIGKPQKHMASIIMLTDSFIDEPRTRYEWKGKTVTGNLPPSTIVMTDTEGCRYIRKQFPKDFRDKELRIECYDITENGRYKVDRKLNRGW